MDMVGSFEVLLLARLQVVLLQSTLVLNNSVPFKCIAGDETKLVFLCF